MKINEIYRGHETEYIGGSEYLTGINRLRGPWEYLPNSNRFKYAYGKNNFDETKVQIVDDMNNKLVGYLLLDEVYEFPLRNALRVDVITTHNDYRGIGLGQALYGIVLSIMKRPLVSGTTQTPSGRSAWLQLSKIPGVEVVGFISVYEHDLELEPKLIDKIMTKLGGEYLGSSLGDENLHYFAVNVVPSEAAKELKAYTREPIASLYSTYSEGDIYHAGLLARWTGQ